MKFSQVALVLNRTITQVAIPYRHLLHIHFYFVYSRASGKPFSSIQVCITVIVQDKHLGFGYLVIVSKRQCAVWANWRRPTGMNLTCVAYFMVLCSLSKAMFLSFLLTCKGEKKSTFISHSHTSHSLCEHTGESMSHVKTALIYLNTNRNDF